MSRNHTSATAKHFVYNTPMSQKQRFLVNLIFDPEYNGYVADVPQLPGCMSQGKSVEAALRNVRQAIRAYLKGARRG
jgi:predicted RNase H-like HicB family nuclease